MIRFLRVIGILFVIYLIARLLLGNDIFYYSTLPVLSKLILLGVLIYVLYVSIKSARKNSTPASGKTWFYRAIGIVALLFFFREFFGTMSVGLFSSIDNLLEVSESVPPAMMWGVMGLLIGLIYGSVVAWRKYRLNFKITLIPIVIFLLAMFILVMVREPLASNPIEKTPPTNELKTDDNISASSKKFIVNRWVVVDLRGKNNENRQRKNNENFELEFKKNGKCYLNENGSRKLVLYYTISPDGRSILFSNPNNKSESRQIQILSITKNELVIKSELFQNDTAVLRSR